VAKRVTIMLDDELVKKLHDIQAKQIKENNDTVSFSQVINEALKEQLKKK
jgi:metal-responsive CopG/Arc/MetJ family transcriptional regulator